MYRLLPRTALGGLAVLLLLPNFLNAKTWSAEKETAIEQQIYCLSVQVDVTYNEQVRKHLRSYFSTGKRATERILQRGALYLPIFEHYLRINELPEELKYIPVVESRLIADAYSSANAAGLWQFIKPTARAYGLRINSGVDERLDVYRSTEAAMKMLQDLHQRFEDWTLVLAAYNCGPGRVERAIRKSGSREFEKLKRYLPYQTRAYLPKYIATAYAMQHYKAFGISPKTQVAGLTETRLLNINKRLSFRRIAAVTGVSKRTLRKLNPGFLKEVIPASKKGYNLLLPAHALPALEHYLAKAETPKKVLANNQHRYTVNAGDSISILAARFQCSEAAIMKWNNLTRREVLVNEVLRLQLPGAPIRHSP